MTAPVITADRLKLSLLATREDRTFVVESLIGGLEEAQERAQVAWLRREHGFPLPAPDWEAADDEGVVLLCRTGGAAVGAVRLVHGRVGAGELCPYFTPELQAALPADPAGFVLCERLVISPHARSLEALAMVMHAAAIWSADLWPVAEFVAITRPELVRLAAWLGARPLSEAMVLPGTDRVGLLIGGHLAEATSRTHEVFSTGGWHLSTPQPAAATSRNGLAALDLKDAPMPAHATLATAGTAAGADQLATAAQAVIDGRVHLTSRTLDEYRLLFGLTDQDLLSGPVLDCPGGASSFAAESRALGAHITSADPVYRLPPEELESLVRDHLEATAAFGLAIADQLDFSWAGSPEQHLERWQHAADTFLQDYAADHRNPTGRSYVPAALPELPFADEQFRISLCGFLLFTFPDALDQEAAVRELVRVTDGEVLIGPLEDPLGSPCRTLDLLRTRLADTGITTAVRDIGYSIHPAQRGLLACRRTR